VPPAPVVDRDAGDASNAQRPAAPPGDAVLPTPGFDASR
jgi:hypothetical protein